MKIMILANYDVGLYQFRREIIAELLKKHEVLISLPYGELVPELEKMGCHFLESPVDRRGINPGKDLKLFATYRRLLKQHQPDLVITYTIKPNIYGGLACRLQRIPYAGNITGLGTAFQNKGLLRTLVVNLYRVGLKKARVVFFENSANRDLFLQEEIISAKNSCLLNGAGVNLEHYSLVPYPETDTTHFLFMGRVMKEKGIEELFAAMSRLHQEGENCCLDVLGGYEENYAELIQRYEKEGWLRYHGYQKEVRPYIERCHCFVLPSYHEGMANTNLECAAMGRPVITSDIPGCREAVIAGTSGLLCESQNAESLYDAMRSFLELSQEERVAMGLAGRGHMEKVFDKMRVVEETISALNIK